MRRLPRTIGMCAGCASTAGRASGSGQRDDPGPATASLPLITSAGTGQATWAVVPMGAPSGPNEFWQLFLQPAGRSHWSLATPPDIATNGAIALAGLSGRALVAGIHPSLYLDYSPVTSTGNAGQSWAPGPPAPGLASVPDALAATPGGGHLLTLDRAGQVQAGDGAGGWATLGSTRALAATAAGHACGLAKLTAVAFGPAAVPLTAGDCTRAGAAGIFAYQGGSWHAAGPPLPATVAGQDVDVLGLTSTGGHLVALLQAGAAGFTRLLVAWTAGGGRWTCSPTLGPARQGITAAAFGAGGAVSVALANGTGATLAGPGAGWRPLPALPAGQAVGLAQPPSGGLDALAADGGELTVWQLRPGGTGWARAQAISVPIQYGSSS
jgi:hypothetical protein